MPKDTEIRRRCFMGSRVQVVLETDKLYWVVLNAF
jgi:hypothetical protein